MVVLPINNPYRDEEGTQVLASNSHVLQVQVYAKVIRDRKLYELLELPCPHQPTNNDQKNRVQEVFARFTHTLVASST